VTLSFARAKGRNYRQLPDRARSRERPSPADIVYFKRYSLSRFAVKDEMLFSTRECRSEGYLGSIMPVGSGTEMGGRYGMCEDTTLPRSAVGPLKR
jgi:hypothetical protein